MTTDPAVPRAMLDEGEDDELRAALFQLAVEDPIVDMLHSNILLKSISTRQEGDGREVPQDFSKLWRFGPAR
jgi:hypothetical protein